MRSLYSRDIGIDLGTTNFLVFVKGKGIVINEPSVVAINKETREILAVGKEAKQMIGRTPRDIITIRPINYGVITDIDFTRSMIKHFINKAMLKGFILKPRAVVGVHTRITAVEEKAVHDAILQAGAREAYLIEEPVAAAIGSGLIIHEPAGNMIVDIGGGTTDIVVISVGGIVTSHSIRVAGNKMDEAIIQHFKKKYNLLIGEQTAEQIKIDLGAACCRKEAEHYKAKGMDSINGLPKTKKITSEEISEVLLEPVNNIIEAIKTTLEKTPPELVADIIDRGIIMTGGGSLLQGLDRLISEQTGIPVYLVKEPFLSVAYGTGHALENINMLRRILIEPKKLA